MGINPRDVSAVIVTRGDTDLTPVLESLPGFREVIVVDNSKEPRDFGVYGRYFGMGRAKSDVVAFIDDDLILKDWDSLLAGYEDGKLCANMIGPEWWRQCGYLDFCLVGAGSLVHRDVVYQARARYLAVHPHDEFLARHADFCFAPLMPYRRFELETEILAVASAENRLWRQPGQMEQKWEAINRARALRRVCVSMIVKDEAENIRRCIESAKGFYDYLAVVDTGSTDGTQDAIREIEPDVLLEEREWFDFPTNRNQSLRLAESTGADYILILDADDELIDKPAGGWGALAADAYYMHYAGPQDIAQTRLIRAGLGWRWIDTWHNRLTCDDPDNVWSENKYEPLIKHHGWGRHGKKQILTNLEKAREMLNGGEVTPRLIFHLARTLEGGQKYDEALEMYRVRSQIQMEEGDEEQWFSQYMVGELLCYSSFSDGADELLKAWRMRPWRNEPLRRLALHCTNVSARTPYPEGDLVFIDRASYQGGADG